MKSQPFDPGSVSSKPRFWMTAAIGLMACVAIGLLLLILDRNSKAATNGQLYNLEDIANGKMAQTSMTAATGAEEGDSQQLPAAEAEIVGIWRRQLPASHDQLYCEIAFKADGSYVNVGKNFGEDYQTEGTWFRQGDEVVIDATNDGSGRPMSGRVTYTLIEPGVMIWMGVRLEKNGLTKEEQIRLINSR